MPLTILVMLCSAEKSCQGRWAILLAHIVPWCCRVLPHLWIVLEDIATQAQESTTVTLAGGWGAIWPNCGTIVQKPFGKEVPRGCGIDIYWCWAYCRRVGDCVLMSVGVPRKILTNQGSNFTSWLLTELYRLLHVHAIRISPYHLQTDSLVERFNQTHTHAMEGCTDQRQGLGQTHSIPAICISEGTQGLHYRFSPFELLYGRAVLGPLDILRESWEAAKKDNDSVVSYILSLREKLQKTSQLARSNLQAAQSTQKEGYDRMARERSFQLGDQVLILLLTTANKLAAEWQGPYRIVNRVGEVNYVVHMRDCRKNWLFHVNMLQKTI